MKGTLRWSTLQCKWTLPYDDQIHSDVINITELVANNAVRWSRLQHGIQHFRTGGERHTAVINTTGGDQRYRMRDYCYSAVMNTRVEMNYSVMIKTTVLWSTEQWSIIYSVWRIESANINTEEREMNVILRWLTLQWVDQHYRASEES
jgi:hypothetical protein